MRNYFPKRPSGALLHPKSNDDPVGFVPHPPYFEAEYCFFRGPRRVAVARYRMIFHQCAMCIFILAFNAATFVWITQSILLFSDIFCQ